MFRKSGFSGIMNDVPSWVPRRSHSGPLFSPYCVQSPCVVCFIVKTTLDPLESDTLGKTPASHSWNWWLHWLRYRLSHTVMLSWYRHEFHNVSFGLLGHQCSCVHAVLGTSTLSMEYFRSKTSGNYINVEIWMYINWGKHYPEWSNVVLTRNPLSICPHYCCWTTFC